MSEEKRTITQKELILIKSSALFWEKGYTETSMKDIAGACGFRPANIYNFFPNKESILYEILHRELMDLLEPIKHLEHDEKSNPLDELRHFIDHHIKLTLGEKRHSKLLFDAGLKNLSPENLAKIIALRDKYDSISRAIIERGIKQDIFSPVDAKLVVYSIASIITRSRIWFSPQGRYSIDDFVEFVYNFALRGLGYKD